MKKIFIGSLLAVGLASGIAYAHGNNWGGHMMGSSGHHYGMMGGSGDYYGRMSGQGMMMGGPGMMGGNTGYDCPGAALSGRDTANAELNQKYFDETAQLRKQMHDLRFEYNEAYRNPQTTREVLTSLEQKMNDLRNQMYEISEKLRAQ